MKTNLLRFIMVLSMVITIVSCANQMEPSSNGLDSSGVEAVDEKTPEYSKAILSDSGTKATQLPKIYIGGYQRWTSGGYRYGARTEVKSGPNADVIQAYIMYRGKRKCISTHYNSRKASCNYRRSRRRTNYFHHYARYQGYTWRSVRKIK